MASRAPIGALCLLSLLAAGCSKQHRCRSISTIEQCALACDCEIEWQEQVGDPTWICVPRQEP